MTNDFNIPAVPVHPGVILAEEFLAPMEMTQTALAEHLGVPVRRINEICRGRRAVTAETGRLSSIGERRRGSAAICGMGCRLMGERECD